MAKKQVGLKLKEKITLKKLSGLKVKEVDKSPKWRTKESTIATRRQRKDNKPDNVERISSHVSAFPVVKK